MILFHLITSLAFADPIVTTISEGDIAPFSGTLFNKEAVATILAQSSADEAKCNTKIELEVNKAKLEFERDLRYAESEFESCELSLEQLGDENIDLVKKHNRAVSMKPYVFGGGILSGIMLTLLVTYAVNGVQ
jgi:hypothetical protein